jgi:pimeloyl-ACP methyl ester carboxylesterase
MWRRGVLAPRRLGRAVAMANSFRGQFRHDFPSTRSLMICRAAAIIAARHRVILLDRPGLGWSERRGSGGSSPAYQAARLDAADRLARGWYYLGGQNGIPSIPVR